MANKPNADDDRDNIEPTWIALLPSFLRLRLSNRLNLQKSILNFFWLSWEHVYRLALSFFVGILVARYLGPTDWGKYSYAIAFVGLFTPLVHLGLKNILIREIVTKPSSVNIF